MGLLGPYVHSHCVDSRRNDAGRLMVNLEKEMLRLARTVVAKPRIDTDKWYIVHPESGKRLELVSNNGYRSKSDAEDMSDVLSEDAAEKFGGDWSEYSYDVMQGWEIVQTWPRQVRQAKVEEIGNEAPNEEGREHEPDD